MALTSRQETVLVLYYVEGWSQRRIGRHLGITHRAVQTLIHRGGRWIIERAADEGVATLPLVKALFASNEGASPTRHIGRAITRQEELLDELQLRLEQRESELAMYEQWLDGDSHLPSHVKRNPYDQWEMRYLTERKAEPLPTSAYNPTVAAKYCGKNAPACTLGCSGCRRGG